MSRAFDEVRDLRGMQAAQALERHEQLGGRHVSDERLHVFPVEDGVLAKVGPAASRHQPAQHRPRASVNAEQTPAIVDVGQDQVVRLHDAAARDVHQVTAKDVGREQHFGRPSTCSFLSLIRLPLKRSSIPSRCLGGCHELAPGSGHYPAALPPGVLCWSISRIFSCCSSICSCRTFIVCSAVRVSWSASARASWLAEITFWPTKMIGRSTNWRKAWLIHEMPVTVSPWRKAIMAFGKEISARSAKT